MTERRDAVRRPARAPLPPRSRKRWAVAAAVAAGWVVLLTMTGSAIGATLLLAVLAVLGVVSVLLLRSLGVTGDHPWIRRLAARPWRDGQDVLQLALRHLSEVFVITPSGSLLAPSLVELRLNPDDLHSLSERMDLGLIAAPSVPAGRYDLRQGQPVDANPEPGFQLAHPGPEFTYRGPQPAYAAPQPAHAGPQSGYAGPEAVYAGPRAAQEGPYRGFAGHDGATHGQPEPDQTAVTGMPTVMEPSRSLVPVLRLVTGGSVAETRMSGARAGRGAVELGLPEVPTVSREHARFTFSDGQWWIANLGMNGLTLNGALLVGEHPLSTGDSIRWGTRPDALMSTVEIG